MNGPFCSGKNDKLIFNKHGLKSKLEATNRKVFGDGGYSGNPELCSTPNIGNDKKDVAKLKSCIQMWQEKFNGMIKEFGCFKMLFWHSEAKFKICFEAAAVVGQYHMDIGGEPLWDL